MSAWDSKASLLARRELWEHKSLWLAPSVVALLIVVLPLFGNFHIGLDGLDAREQLRAELAPQVGPIMLMTLAGVLGLIACIVTVIYLLDCLYAERRDRSILFWKSLPVSDAQTVLSKLLVAMLLIPVFTLLLAMVAYLLMTGLLALRYEVLRPAMSLASIGRAFGAMPDLAGGIFFSLLWYTPVSAYLMLASVLAKRSPLVYAVLPPVVLMLIEQMLFGTGHVGRFLGYRLAPWFRPESSGFGSSGEIAIPTPDWSRVISEPDLWLGLAVAAGMVYIVIRLRRYRDDT
jgi:ABC-2 type transport system permease protein